MLLDAYTILLDFGYYDVASAKKYKVIRFSYDIPSAEKRCEVFDLGSDHWRRVEDPPFPLIGDAPFVNRAIYCKTDINFVLPGHYVMVSFDIKTEKFQELPPPKGILDPQSLHFDMYLIKLNGLLCMADSSSYSSLQRDGGLDLWLLKDYRNVVWVKQYSIDLTCLNDYYLDDLGLPVIVEGSRILMLFSRRKKLVYYDLQIKSFSEVDVEVEGLLECGLGGLRNCGLYVENLSFSRGLLNSKA